MKTKQWVIVVAVLVVISLIVWVACRHWPARQRLEDAVIDLYIKIVCEK